MTNIVLKHTSDYSKFRLNEQNRLIMGSEGYRPRPDLMKSMKSHGFRRAQPIRVYRDYDGSLRIFDGHNRYITAKYLGIPVWYLEFHKDDAISPVQDNQQTRLWGIKDKAKAHATESPDYAEIIAFHEATGISVRGSFSMFAGQTASSSNYSREIGEGTFRIKNRELPWKVAEVVFAIKKYAKYGATDGLVTAISKIVFIEKFDVERMIERIHKRHDLLRQCRSWYEYIEMLEEVYNYGVKGERLYLTVETKEAMRKRNPAYKRK